MIPVEFPLDSSGNSTGSVEILLDSVAIPFDSSGIPLDSSGIPLDSSGILIEFHLIPVEIPLDSSAKTALINPLHRTTKFTQNSVSYL